MILWLCSCTNVDSSQNRNIKEPSFRFRSVTKDKHKRKRSIFHENENEPSVEVEKGCCGQDVVEHEEPSREELEQIDPRLSADEERTLASPVPVAHLEHSKASCGSSQWVWVCF